MQETSIDLTRFVSHNTRLSGSGDGRIRFSAQEIGTGGNESREKQGVCFPVKVMLDIVQVVFVSVCLSVCLSVCSFSPSFIILSLCLL